MKLLKSCIVLFASVALISCGSDDDAPAPASFNLSAENIVGTYSMDELDRASTSTILTSEGSETEDVSEVGDTFSVDLDLLEDNTYTISGGYRLETTVNTEEPTAVVLTVSETGTYVLNDDDDQITFITSSTEESPFLSGLYEIERFSETSLDLFQETSDFIQDQVAGTTTNTSSAVNYAFGIER